MDRTSIQDFQIYHNTHAIPHAAPSEPYDHPIQSIEPYTDEDEAHEGSLPHSSDPDEPIFDHPSRHSSPATSRHSDEDISTLASEPYDVSSSLPPDRRVPSPFTPVVKTRSPFRNPSSIRAMQMETTPPPYLISPSSSQQRYKFPTPSRNGTPRSQQQRSPSKLSPTKKAKKEYPLVLLHVTLLPLNSPYSARVMESVLPQHILENYKLLGEKTTPTVLSRGILIPHPHEDYDLLEERLLESLDLTLPRILTCGHFHLDPDTDADLTSAAAEDVEDYTDDPDANICTDCGRRIRDGRMGAGRGDRRWDVKIYAANGLMRAGAWGAAWREMERVDVEIGPWIGEEMRRELEVRREKEEEEEEEMEREREGERARRMPDDGGLDGLFGTDDAVAVDGGRGQKKQEKAPRMDEARLREIYGDDAQAFVDGLRDSTPPPSWPDESESRTSPLRPPRFSHPRSSQRPAASTRTAKTRHQTLHQHRHQHKQHQTPHRDIPLRDLLRNYILLAAQDARNIAILVLGFLVLLLAVIMFATPPSAGSAVPASAASRAVDAGAGADGIPTLAVPPSVVSVAVATAARAGDVGADAVAKATAGGGSVVVESTTTTATMTEAAREGIASVAGEVFASVKSGVVVMQEVLGGDMGMGVGVGVEAGGGMEMEVEMGMEMGGPGME